MRFSVSIGVFILFFASGKVAAGDLTESMRFKRLLHGDSDSSAVINTVNVTAQDRDGFIWFGGELGLARYDGHEIRIYQHNPQDPHSLTSNVIWDIAFDHNGVMWLATSGGLGRYNPARDDFTSYRSQGFDTNSFTGDSVRVLAVDKDNNLLIGTDNGFSILDAEREWYRSFTDRESDPNRIPGSSIHALLPEDNGDIWLGTMTSGLVKLRLNPLSVEVFAHSANDADSLANNRITSILRDHTGALWVSTFGGGISRMNDDGLTFKNYLHDPNDPTTIGSNTVWVVFEDSYNNLWAATDHGGLALYNREQDTFSHLRHDPYDKTSLSSNQIRSIFEDREGDLWIGTFPIGTNFFDRSSTLFRNYVHLPQDASSLSHSTILTMEKSRQGHLWIGTEGGINAFDLETKKSHRIVAKPGTPGALQSNAVLSLAERDNGDLWVGTWSGGLYKRDHETENFTQFMPADNDDNTVNSAYIWSLLIDSKQQLWIGTETGGLNRYNFETERFEYFEASVPPTPNTVSNVLIWTLLEDHAGFIWAGSAHGLNRFDPETEEFTHYFNDPANSNSLCSNRTIVLFEDSRKHIWIGTQGGGISVLDPSRENFQHISTRNGLPSDNVASIIEDKSGRIWAMTDKGIALVSLEEGVINKYQKAHGLIGNNFNRDATYVHDSGELYLGSTEGLSVFNPENAATHSSAPKVTLTDFRVFNESLTAKTPESPLQKAIADTTELTLQHHQHFFSVGFSALNYRSASQNQYAYRLLGFDKDWNYVGNRNTANYTNISPGRYILQIKAASANGEWGQDATELRIHILPPPWRTWWAYAIYLLLALYLLWAIYRYKTKRMELEKEREVISKLIKIDKMKDAFLANTSHELRTPLNGIIGLAELLRDSSTQSMNSEQLHRLNMIVASGKRLSHLINDILDMSKLAEQEIELKKVPLDLQYQTELVISLLAPLTTSKSIELINAVPKTLHPVVADQNRLQQILLNLIGNGIKYTDKGFVKISAEQTTDETIVRIEDTGIGMEEKHLNAIFQSFYQIEDSDVREHGGTGLGLSITRQLVELHRGEISVASRPGKGTTITFTIPDSQLGGAYCELKPTKEERLLSMSERLEKDVNTSVKSKNIEPPVATDKVKANGELAIAAPANSNQVTILIVDDDPINRMVLHGILKLHNYRIFEADDGESAIRFIEQNPDVDLVVLDVMMPRMTGYEACKIIRKTHPIHSLPIIFLTAKDVETELTEGFVCGGNDFVHKPVKKEEFLARIKAQLSAMRKV